MLNQLKKLLSEFTAQPVREQGIDFNTALAALLVEVMRADGQYLAVESEKIAELLVKRCELNVNQVKALLNQAEQMVEEAIDLYVFVKQINSQTTDVERIEIIELLWCVAYADGELDSYEDHTIRKIAGLLYVSHVDFIAAKLSANPHQ